MNVSDFVPQHNQVNLLRIFFCLVHNTIHLLGKWSPERNTAGVGIMFKAAFNESHFMSVKIFPINQSGLFLIYQEVHDQPVRIKSVCWLDLIKHGLQRTNQFGLCLLYE